MDNSRAWAPPFLSIRLSCPPSSSSPDLNSVAPHYSQFCKYPQIRCPFFLSHLPDRTAAICFLCADTHAEHFCRKMSPTQAYGIIIISWSSTSNGQHYPSLWSVHSPVLHRFIPCHSLLLAPASDLLHTWPRTFQFPSPIVSAPKIYLEYSSFFPSPMPPPPQSSHHLSSEQLVRPPDRAPAPTNEPAPQSHHRALSETGIDSC